MLFFLTGDIQIGKTRWLMDELVRLESQGIEPCGVIAPGIWVPREDGFEKLGIDNMLLPEKRTISFARRRDLAEADGELDAGSQAGRAQLGWAIRDEAIDEVNVHFDALARIKEPGRRLLVVDELGRLELLAGGGLTSALALLDRGATSVFPHALVVVRETLLDSARERFAAVDWGGMRAIAPGDEASQLLESTL